MSKREFCETHNTIAYYSGLDGLEVKGFEYGIEDYMYCVTGALCGKKTLHKLKVYDGEYVKLHGYKIRLDECFRTGV